MILLVNDQALTHNYVLSKDLGKLKSCQILCDDYSFRLKHNASMAVVEEALSVSSGLFRRKINFEDMIHHNISNLSLIEDMIEHLSTEHCTIALSRLFPDFSYFYREVYPFIEIRTNDVCSFDIARRTHSKDLSIAETNSKVLSLVDRAFQLK